MQYGAIWAIFIGGSVLGLSRASPISSPGLGKRYAFSSFSPDLSHNDDREHESSCHSLIDLVRSKKMRSNRGGQLDWIAEVYGNREF